MKNTKSIEEVREEIMEVLDVACKDFTGDRRLLYGYHLILFTEEDLVTSSPISQDIMIERVFPLMTDIHRAQKKEAEEATRQ